MRWTNTKKALFLIVLWSLAVHLPGVFSPLRDYHAYRQCQTASMSRNYVRHGLNFLSPEVDTEGPPVRAGSEFPIYSYLLAILYRLFGVHEFLGRLLSSLFAAWGAGYLYLFIRQRLDERIALWSGLVMCSIPIHIYFTRTVQPEPMALWGILGFLYYSDQWLYHRGGLKAWMWAVILGATAPLLKLPFLYIVFPLWAYLGYERFGPKVFKTISWLSVMALILIMTESWYFYAKTAAVVLLPLKLQDHLANLAPVLTLHLWQAQFISRVPELVCTYSGLFFIVVGVTHYRKTKSYKFFLIWSAICALYVVLLGEYGLIHRYTLLPLAPLSAVWIASGICVSWDFAQSIRRGRWIMTILILGIPIHAALRIKHWYRLDYSYISRAKADLSSVSLPTDLVLVSSHETPEILYYLDHYGYALEPQTWTPRDLDAMKAHGAAYVLIPMEDNEKRLSDWKASLQRRARKIQEDPDFWLYQFS